MRKKLSCSQYKPRNARSLVLCVLSLAWIGAAGISRAAAPEWLRTAARESLPNYPKETVAVLLLSEQMTTVRENGEIETLYRRAYKILRPEARERYGTFAVDFDKDTRLSNMKAWCLPATGNEFEVKEKDAVETGFSEELYNDTHHKVLTIPAAVPGNVIGYEYVQRKRPYVLQDEWWFQRTIPVRRARFWLKLPAGWEFDSFWANFKGPDLRSNGENQYVWELENIPAIEPEPGMPAWLALAGRLAVKYFPRDPSLREQNRASWESIGKWYAGLIASRRDATPEIKQKVSELITGKTNALDKMKVIASFLQRQIRYVAIEIGIGGYQPHTAGEVFTHHYGDCKDKVTLLSTMLHEIGIESYYVLVDTNRGIVLPEFPSAMSFNHVILAIRLPEAVTGEGLFASQNHPKIGRLLFFDPTDPYTPLGYLPSSLQKNYGLLIGPEGGELVGLPLLPPASNRLLRTAKLTLNLNGTVSGEVEEIRWGAPAADQRALFLRTAPAERAKVLEHLLGSSLAGFALTKATIVGLEEYDQNLVVRYEFVAQNYAKTAGTLLLIRPRVLGNKGSDVMEKQERKYPVEFAEATLHSDLFEFTLPPGFVVDELPAPLKTEFEFGKYSSKVEARGNTLRYERLYEIKDVTKENFTQLKKFFQQIAADERSNAILRREAP
ncbi:MAG: DUF3857 domain-containing protein [Acidobacteriia bacterium]|nr:DUF3857 domain-containing protein [Terriglobia bacterium]